MGGWDVLLVEAAPFLGAGVRTLWFGGHPYTFGPRHFLTRDPKVYEYLNSIVQLRDCTEHEFLTYVEPDGQFYQYPIHEDDIERMPDGDEIKAELKAAGVANPKNLEEYWISSVGRRLYSKFVDKYSKKMWGIDDNRLIDSFEWSPKGVAIRRGPRAAWGGFMSAYPYAPDGYNRYFEVATEGVKPLLSTKIEKYDIPNRSVWIKGEKHAFDLIVNTISPDELFDRCHGELRYMGRDFHKIVFPVEHVFPERVYFLYYANDEQFTRIVEFKKLTRHEAPTSLLGMEIPSHNGKYYPLPFEADRAIARKYFELMPQHVYSMGRAGSYRYPIDIGDCISQALEFARHVKAGGRDYPVPGEKYRGRWRW
jgi:UDP-galactopyranose mutase